MTQSKTTLRLPFVSNSYPDEILGSWLTRVALSLGGGPWQTLLEEAGIGRRLNSRCFDMVEYDDGLNRLFSLLGITYESVLLKLTTLPYWLTFEANSNQITLPGTAKIPALRSRKDVFSTSTANLGTQRTKRYRPDLRYCPKCLLWDYQNVGQPYWHRAHQLPNIYLCHKHLCELRTACAHCGIAALRSASRMIPMPLILCQCGKRLDVPRQSRTPSAAELRLIDISVRALNQELPDWHCQHVYEHFKLLLNDRNRMLSYKTVLSSTFSLIERNKSILSSAQLCPAGDRFRFKVNLSYAGAPECCGLLVALNADFDSAIRGFRKHAAENKIFISTPPIGPRIKTMTVETSRLSLLKGKEKYPSMRLSYFRKDYWYLRLNDSEWLFDRFPGAINTVVPSVASDRSAILAIYATQGARLVYPTRVTEVVAGLRAQLRDSDWFQEQRMSNRVAVKRNKEIAKIILFANRVAALEKALDQVLENERRPTWISSPTLAAIAGLSHSKAVEIIRVHSPLRHRIEKANADKKRRQFLWAAQQLHLEGGRLNKKQIGKRAGLPAVEVSDEIFREICSLYFTE